MSIKFIGYGSLLSHKSLEKTIPDRIFTPVIIKGVKRVFNVDLKPHSQENVNVLNIVKEKDAFINAIMMEINEEELAQLKKREEHYIFEEIDTINIYSQKIYSDCLVSINYNYDIDTKGKKPFNEYFKLCREAAYDISEEFGEMWDETTFTSDGKTINQFLEENPQYKSIKKKQYDSKTKKVCA